jgi:hypothetical protein
LRQSIVLYFVKIAIYGLEHLRNFRICDNGMSPRICGFVICLATSKALVRICTLVVVVNVVVQPGIFSSAKICTVYGKFLANLECGGEKKTLKIAKSGKLWQRDFSHIEHSLKGTVSRDFLLIVFLMNQFLPSP